MEIISYILSGLSLSLMILASLVKGRHIRLILLLVFMGNFLAASSYLIGGAVNGAVTCYLGAVLTIINYFFDCKNKRIPVWLHICYAMALIAVNIIAAGGLSYLGLLVIVASLTFILCIGQSNGKMYRFWTILNMLIWCSYDILSKMYAPLMQHLSLLLITVIGMIIHDLKKRN